MRGTTSLEWRKSNCTKTRVAAIAGLRLTCIFAIRGNMNAIVISFPKPCAPRPKGNLKVPKARQGVGNTWVTTYGQFANLPFAWGRFFRLLVIIEPTTDDGQ